MFEIRGKYNTAKVYTEKIEESAISQIYELCNQEFAKDSKIRIMPDVHTGAGCTIGTTMTIQDKVVPNLVGVDIGCGMETVRFTCKDLDLEKLDQVIHDKIPSGMRIRNKDHPFNEKIELLNLRCFDRINYSRARKSIGTLGGGNHFIEVNEDEEGNYYLVIHSGSRHLGNEAARYYQNTGYKFLKDRADRITADMIAEYKKQGRNEEISGAVKQVRQDISANVPKHLAFLEGKLFDDYMNDMKLIQQYAQLNRKAIAQEIIQTMGFGVEEQFTTIHNYIDTDTMVLRKGAVSAQKGEKLLIPINMRDGSLICVGKGNEDWNCSAPHGAGRLFSRSAAKSKFTLEEFEKEMDGIYTTSVHRSTLDECPMAYKSMDDIVDNIEPTAEITKIIRPVYNFKAGD